MLQVTSNSTIYIASKAIDFRKGIDGIAAICRNQLNIQPMDGAIFLFYNKQINSIKILTYDGQANISFAKNWREIPTSPKLMEGVFKMLENY